MFSGVVPQLSLVMGPCAGECSYSFTFTFSPLWDQGLTNDESLPTSCSEGRFFHPIMLHVSKQTKLTCALLASNVDHSPIKTLWSKVVSTKRFGC